MLKIVDFLSDNAIKHEKANELTFECGCGKLIKNANKHSIAWWNHLKKAHNLTVPPNSSHIFLCKRNMKKGSCVYRMVNVDDKDNSRGWYCPCQYGTDMSKEELIKHVLYVHKGMSPAYDLF